MNEAYELSITRLIDAPVAAVWRAWTEDTGAWFCPKPWTAEFLAQDLAAGRPLDDRDARPERRGEPAGGHLSGGPAGVRIVSTDAFTAGWHPAGPFMVRIDSFAEEDGKTRYTATARHWTREAMDSHAAMGFEGGMERRHRPARGDRGAVGRQLIRSGRACGACRGDGYVRRGYEPPP
ncbi:MAG: SRPBCC domain-containing protein [Sphingomonas taxi]